MKTIQDKDYEHLCHEIRNSLIGFFLEVKNIKKAIDKMYKHGSRIEDALDFIKDGYDDRVDKEGSPG